jgi:acyl carrier protein
MTNLEKYNHAFTEIFGIQVDALSALAYQSVAQWDSVGHMRLMVDIEGKFDIMLDTEDTMAFSSYDKGKEILKKYGVEI